MTPMIPNPRKIKSFRTEAAFETWLAANHARETEMWLKVHKKGSGLPTVTIAQALDVALCWGWIDGIRKGFDERSFLQRYTPRTAKSIWSQINRDNVARLTAAGRMTPHGQRQVDAAKADGRGTRPMPPCATRPKPPFPRPPRRDRGKPAGAEDVPDPRPPEPLFAGVSHQQHEDAGRPRQENRGAGGDAGARRDHRAGSAPASTLTSRTHRRQEEKLYAPRNVVGCFDAGPARRDAVGRSAARRPARRRAAPAAPAMTMTVAGFADGADIPVKFSQAAPGVATGEGLSPAITWANVPAGTQSFFLNMHDMDVARNKTTDDQAHWVVWNIPATATGLPEGVPKGAKLANGAFQFSATGQMYRGPGAGANGPKHHYMFELYALDTMLDVQPAADAFESRANVMKAIQGHILGKAVYGGLFRRPQ